MKAIKISLVFLFLVIINLNGQNLIGSDETEIRQYMLEKQKGFAFQNFINNSTFKYLKYSDSNETETLLFFLNDQLICKSVRLVCDKSLKPEKIKEFNSLYKKEGNNNWTETKNGRSYLIELRDEEWSFNVTITLNEKLI
jgi:hypothetical protein